MYETVLFGPFYTMKRSSALSKFFVFYRILAKFLTSFENQESAKRIKEKKTWRNWRKITNLGFRLNLWVNLIFKFFVLNFIKQIAIKSFDEKKSLINILTEDNESLFFEKTSFWSNLPSIFKVKKKLNLDSINKFGTKLESLRKRQINPRPHVLPTNTVLELWKKLLQLVLSHSKGNLLHIEVNKTREILRAKLEPPLST